MPRSRKIGGNRRRFYANLANPPEWSSRTSGARKDRLQRIREGREPGARLVEGALTGGNRVGANGRPADRTPPGLYSGERAPELLDGFTAVTGMQLPPESGDVGPHRARGKYEPLRDLSRRVVAREQVEYLPLAAREPPLELAGRGNRPPPRIPVAELVYHLRN
jgi:hypothetical protein